MYWNPAAQANRARHRIKGRGMEPPQSGHEREKGRETCGRQLSRSLCIKPGVGAFRKSLADERCARSDGTSALGGKYPDRENAVFPWIHPESRGALLLPKLNH